MTSHQKEGCTLNTRSLGFVVAMRAKLTNTPHPPCFEWVIVSRWGTGGEHLSIGWTAQPALSGEAPINLAPVKTSLALRPPQTAADTPAMFILAPALPNEITVAGDFLPAEGYVHLYGRGAKLRVSLKGLCLSCPVRSYWEVEAARAAWLGEFIEPAPGRHA
jgi:hypothetical protein